jgi:hypothetical protein
MRRLVGDPGSPTDRALGHPAEGQERAAWLQACFAPRGSFPEVDVAGDPSDPAWRPIAFWWSTPRGLQLVVMPRRAWIQ